MAHSFPQRAFSEAAETSSDLNKEPREVSGQDLEVQVGYADGVRGFLD